MRHSTALVFVAVLLGVVFGQTPITTLPYTNSGDTSLSGSVTAPCEFDAKQGDLYSFTGNGEFIFATTCTEYGGDSNYDSEIYVWVAGSTGTCETVADDNCGISQSYATFFATAGVDYIIFVSGYSEFTGTYTLVVGSNGAPPTPTPITSLPFTTSGNTATSGLYTSSCYSEPKQGDLFSYTGNGEYVFATTCPSDGGSADFDTVIYVVNSDGDCVVYDDDTCDYQSYVSFFAAVGEEYLIFITGYFEDTGSYTLVVGESEPVTPTPIPNTPFVTSGNTGGGGQISPCGEFPTTGDLYSLIGDDNDYYATTCDVLGGSADGDSVIYVWIPGADTCVVIDDDTCGLGSYATWTAAAGQEYWILVAGYGGDAIDYTLVVDKGNPGTTTTTGDRKRSLAEKAHNAQVAAASSTAGGLALVALVCIGQAIALMM